MNAAARFYCRSLDRVKRIKYCREYVGTALEIGESKTDDFKSGSAFLTNWRYLKTNSIKRPMSRDQSKSESI